MEEKASAVRRIPRIVVQQKTHRKQLLASSQASP
jgi:hypothetical protein